MARALGSPSDLIERPSAHLAAAPIRRDVVPERHGIVGRIDTRALGLAVIALGGGRVQAGDPVDHAVGLTGLAGLGERVNASRPLAILHARNEEGGAAAEAAVRAAYTIGDEVPTVPAPVGERIEAP